MSRERTTWKNTRQADDPRAMNQDHLSQQPAADDYLVGTGTPSEFAEDVTPPNWEAEDDASGETARNEIGMPQFREASEEQVLTKKANVCITTARLMLKNASESEIEDQAVVLMNLSDADVVATLARVAAEGEDDEDEEEEQVQEEQVQEKQAAQDEEAPKEEAQEKQAAQEEAPKDEEGQDKQAAQDLEEQLKAAMASQDYEAVQKIAQQLQSCQSCGAPQPPMAALPGVHHTKRTQEGLDEEQMLSALLGGDPEQQMAMQQQMMQNGMMPMAMPETEIEMLAPEMLVDDGPVEEDPQLTAIFAANPEVQAAMTARALQTGMPVPAPAPIPAPAPAPQTRTASANPSTRTVGTIPSGGVSQLGGGSSGSAPDEINKLAGLWKSEPDVSQHFS